ncbi:MAG: hypothetical protein HY761_06745 [Candidatus Omnitrophica bacterium]|nr:hypothetical protein [Candidatus Omnitrophota bacterium]
MRIKTVFRFLAVCLFLLFTATDPVFSQDELSVPVPPQSVMLDTHQTQLEGMKIMSFLFESQAEEETINKFYEDYFKKSKFEPVQDRAGKIGRLLRFRKEDLVVNIVITPKQGKNQVVIAQYLQPQNAPGPEELLRNWKNAQGYLPKEDVAGEDLDFIPRPPESIRVLYNKNNQLTFIFYSSKESSKDLMNFYRHKMLALGWEAEEPIDMQEAYREAERLPAMKNAPQLPLSGITIPQLVEGGYILKFKSSSGKAEVSVFNNNYGQEGQGSFVQVSYVQEK